MKSSWIDIPKTKKIDVLENIQKQISKLNILVIYLTDELNELKKKVNSIKIKQKKIDIFKIEVEPEPYNYKNTHNICEQNHFSDNDFD